ncbi:MAG: metabolite traffic protein EboE [Syntrophales bacterium]|nr:metabolite traffic protein EboE [Syntrophales bacterium]
MQLASPAQAHLTYCSKVHPGHGWDQVRPQLEAYLPRLKARLSPQAPFGLGLRLSAAECEEILAGDRLPAFQDFCAAHDIYVFTLNGFPYGAFHGPRVKAEVFAPDWREQARVDYTLRLIQVLQKILPPGLEGSISTAPLSYKPWITAPAAALGRISRNLAVIAHRLLEVKSHSGLFIHLDLEPEPDGLVETCAELAEFFEQWLLPSGGRWLAEKTGLSPDAAREALLSHIQVCQDTCHLAVAYEDPGAALKRLAATGIRVGKVQVTSGWQAALPREQIRRAELGRELARFSRSPYLHQVRGRKSDGGLSRYGDLSQALAQLATAPEGQWRIHYHVPLFIEHYGRLASTQAQTRAVLRLLAQHHFARHLEIETYTWDQLPGDLKLNPVDFLEREYRWTLEALIPASSQEAEPKIASR